MRQEKKYIYITSKSNDISIYYILITKFIYESNWIINCFLLFENICLKNGP